MKKLTKYFYPNEEQSYFDKQKTIFFIWQAYIGILGSIFAIIQTLISHSKNFTISLYSAVSVLFLLVIALFFLKKKGIKFTGNIYSFTIVILLLTWMNILPENVSPIYKYIQGFYSVFALLALSLLFASRRIFIINAILIFATVTRVFLFATTHAPGSADIFITGYVAHTIALTFITIILYFTKKYIELSIEKVQGEIKIGKEQYQALLESKKELLLAQEEIKVSEAKYKQLSNLTFEGIAIHENRIALDVNLSLAKIFGYTPDELIGKNIVKLLIHKDFYKLVSENITKNYALPYEIEGIKKDGTIIPLEIEAQNITDNDGKIIRVAAVRDISLRKKAEKEIRKLSTAVEQSANTVVITDTDGNIEYVNPKFSELTGYTAEEAIGQNPRILNAGTQPKEYYTELWKTISAGKIWKGEFHNKKKNGDYFWENVTITPLKDNTGKVINYLAVKEDITQEKEAIKNLEESEKKLKEAQKVARLGYWELDLIKNKLYWSDEIYRFFGLKPQEFEATYEAFLNNIHPEDREKVNEAYNNSLKTKLPYEIEHRLLLKSGEIKYVLEKCNTEYDINDKPLRSIGTVLEITEIKKAELALQKQNEEYATLNEEYKAMNEELIIAKEKAEESDQLKTEFFHNMSHEVRTPLNGILGFSDLLNTPNLTDEVKKQYIGIIQNSGNQLLSIIDDILEISRLGTRQEKVLKSHVNINEVMTNLYSIFNIKTKEKNISLRLKKSLTDSESTIITDKTKITKILNNLLTNAVKFTSKGFIEFGYTLKADAETPKIEIYVKDTGIGIMPENQETIFERFSQEEKELSRKFGGLGLGLSIAKESAELIGGTITVESEKGKGATFFATIPYEPANPIVEKDSQKLKIRRNKYPLRNYIVLVAEDEETNYFYLETLIGKLKNVRILRAKNGREAVEICKENSEIDLVFMDLKMPVMSGFEATKRIKESRPDLTIIAQTAYSTKEEKELAYSAGCDFFISKPINKEALNKIMDKYL